MRTEGCVIGKYQGKKVYRVTLPEYVNGRYYRDADYIYLIDGELIYNNEAFASYDGNYVSLYDPHEKRTFYEIPTFTASGGIGNKEGYSKSESKDSEETSSTFGDFEFKTVEEILSDSFGSFTAEMTDVDAFLASSWNYM